MAKFTEKELQDMAKQKKALEVSYEMYEKTKKESEKRMKTATNEDGTKKYSQADIDEEMKLINEAQQELLGKYVYFGGDADELVNKGKKTKAKAARIPVDYADKTVVDMLNEINAKEEESKMLTETSTQKIEKDYLPNKGEYSQQASFDVIPLPSRGECYRNKMEKIPVAYLTAYDENMIIAPNLYNDKIILDMILQEKILNNTIDPADMINGDRDAIILFLRASGYGNEYPITATDNVTGQEFDAVVDLSKLKYKQFKLKGDDNGWFDFELPVSKKNIKFKFLTHRDLMTLKKLEELEDTRLRKDRIKEMVDTLDFFIEKDNDIEKAEKVKVRQAIRNIESWEEGMDEDEALRYTHSVTNRLELAIMAVDGNTDRRYISSFVKNMNVKDSSALRKYINANEPGIDYTIEIEKPESLGGGSMSVFLQLDEYVFLNIA